ncbi:MAG: SEC-C metal-binding domain-containing protein [Pirellulaceae bacterium]
MNSLESTFHSATYPQPLWVRGSLCANPECECPDVFLDLLDHADGGRAGDGPPVLEMRVDTETWQEVDAPERPAPLEALAREFLREYSADARAAWQMEVDRKRREARRLREYCFDLRTVEAGTPVFFGDILSEKGSISSGGPMMLDLFEHKGIEYVVDDGYCPKPDCDCHEVHLRFLRCSPTPDGGVLVTDWFQATLALEDRLESIECANTTRGEAIAIFRAWRKTTAVLLDDMVWRYWKVKDIAQRSLAAAGKLPRRKQFPLIANSSPSEILSDPNSRRDPLLPDVTAFADPLLRNVESPLDRRVGRNEPCPCGSGKKFKKCCGRR